MASGQRPHPPTIYLLKDFENKMTNLIQGVTFSNHRNQFQHKLSRDVKQINNDTKLIIPSDKTRQYYRVDKQTYSRLLNDSVTKDYKKTNLRAKKALIEKDLAIASRLNLSDRIEAPAERSARITLKDHKPDWPNTIQCRLLNPFKSEIGLISKQILERINHTVRNSLNINQWQDTSSVLAWFSAIPFNPRNNFIIFDVIDFYPSITQELLTKAIDFAMTYDNISNNERDIIMHTKQSLLYHDGTPWCKKNNANHFDVGMGSYDGAECCELVGVYLLSQLTPIFGNLVGIYRDDGIAITNKTPRQTENLKKTICKIFSDHNLRVTITANKKSANFLDVTLNLNDQSYTPYTKPNSNISYVHAHSNHPPNILKNIPSSINNRLTKTSSNETLFKQSIQPFQTALNHSGYNHLLTYNPNPQPNTNRRNRSRKITWFNPPYSANLRMNLGQRFLQLLNDCFPPTHPLHKICNRNTIKLSYSCLPSMERIIHSHNNRILKQNTNQPTNNRNCNCTNPQSCPLSGECLSKAIVYQATVTNNTNNNQETYIGMTSTSFKLRYSNHILSFNNRKYETMTELSKHVHKVQQLTNNYNITWRILKKCNSYSNVTKKCQLCLQEKFFIICKPELGTLNRRTELMSACRHRKDFVLNCYDNT